MPTHDTRPRLLGAPSLPASLLCKHRLSASWSEHSRKEFLMATLLEQLVLPAKPV